MPLVFTHTHHDARMPLQLPPSNVVARVIARRSSAALVPGTLSRNSGQKRGSPDPPSHVSPAHICSRRDGLQRAHMNIATPRTRCFLRMSVDITHITTEPSGRGLFGLKRTPAFRVTEPPVSSKVAESAKNMPRLSTLNRGCAYDPRAYSVGRGLANALAAMTPNCSHRYSIQASSRYTCLLQVL